MNKAYIIAFLVISVALGFTMWAFSASMSPYVDIKDARKSQNAVQIRGLILRDITHPVRYDTNAKALRFWIKDEKQDEIEVMYHGAKPDGFDAAPGTAAHGYIRKEADGTEVFASDSLIIKCPSKYSDQKSVYSRAQTSGGTM